MAFAIPSSHWCSQDNGLRARDADQVSSCKLWPSHSHRMQFVDKGYYPIFFFFGHSASTWKVHKKSFEIDSDMGNVFTPNELADGGRSFKLYFGEMKISCRLKLSKCQRQDMHSAQRNQDDFRTIFGGRCKAKCYKCLLSNWRWRGGGGKAERWARKIGWKSGRASDDRLSCLHKLSAQGCAHKL